MVELGNQYLRPNRELLSVLRMIHSQRAAMGERLRCQTTIAGSSWEVSENRHGEALIRGSWKEPSLKQL